MPIPHQLPTAPLAFTHAAALVLNSTTHNGITEQNAPAVHFSPHASTHSGKPVAYVHPAPPINCAARFHACCSTCAQLHDPHRPNCTKRARSQTFHTARSKCVTYANPAPASNCAARFHACCSTCAQLHDPQWHN